jgi:hypothetical protein
MINGRWVGGRKGRDKGDGMGTAMIMGRWVGVAEIGMATTNGRWVGVGERQRGGTGLGIGTATIMAGLRMAGIGMATTKGRWVGGGNRKAEMSVTGMGTATTKKRCVVMKAGGRKEQELVSD